MGKNSCGNRARPAEEKAEAQFETGKVDRLLFIAVIVIFIIAAGVHLNTLRNEFVYDDSDQVLNNPWIKDVRSIPSIFTANVWSFLQEKLTSNYYRPMMHMVYMLNYHVYGLKPWGFHLTNILLHAGVSVLVFVITSELLQQFQESSPPLMSFPLVGNPSGERLRTSRSDGWDKTRVYLPAFAAALLFATHPIHTEVVAWVAGVPELSYTLFFLLSFYFYIRSGEGKQGMYALSLISFAVALFCKEPALMLPFILMAYDYCFEGRRANGGSPLQSASFKRYVPYFAIAALYLVMRSYALGGFSPQTPHTKLSMYGYIINAFPLFANYIEKLLLPLNLNAFHVLHPISSLMELKGFVSVIITVVFAAFMVISYKKARPAFLSLLIITLPLLPVLYIPALGINVFAERYLYLPSVGFVVLIAIALSRITTAKPQYTVGLSVLILLVTIGYSAATVKRNAVWKDNLTLFSDTAKRSPDAALMHSYLADAYEKQNRLEEAASELKATLSLSQGYFEAHNNLGVVYAKMNRYKEAIGEIETAIGLKPDFADAHNNLGNVYALQNHLDDAINEFQTAIRLKPDFADAHNNLGNAYALLDRIDDAIREYEILLKLKPENAAARHNLGVCYSKRAKNH